MMALWNRLRLNSALYHRRVLGQEPAFGRELLQPVIDLRSIIVLVSVEFSESRFGERHFGAGQLAQAILGLCFPHPENTVSGDRYIHPDVAYAAFGIPEFV